MDRAFRHTVGSEPDHEDLVGDLYYGDEIVCLVTQEEGPGLLRVELFQRQGAAQSMPLAEFESALAKLRTHMLELKRN